MLTLLGGTTRKRGRGPTGITIRTGEITYVQDFTTDPRAVPWRESALEFGFISNIALPLKGESNNIFGALQIYSSEPNAITSDEIRLLENLTSDLSFGIITLRNRAERKRMETEIKEADERFRLVFDNVFDGISIYSEVQTPLRENSSSVMHATLTWQAAPVRNCLRSETCRGL